MTVNIFECAVDVNSQKTVSSLGQSIVIRERRSERSGGATYNIYKEGNEMKVSGKRFKSFPICKTSVKNQNQMLELKLT